MLTVDTIHQGDCLELMTEIDDESIDMILCDLPYGITACDWDTPLDFDKLWAQYKRIIKPRGAIVLTASQPFTSKLVMSNLAWFKYEWIWEKTTPSLFVHAANRPMAQHENILIFSPSSMGHSSLLGDRRMIYNPQGVKKGGTKTVGRKPNFQGQRPKQEGKRYEAKKNYPNTVIKLKREGSFIHPTQKPVALFEYLIRTYTDKGDLILDNCIGSGTTAVAALNNDRHFIGIELSAEYCDVARRRIERETRQQRLF